MIYDALAYRRFRWPDVPDEVGDVERILTWSGGTSLLVKDYGDNVKLLPCIVREQTREPFRPLYINPIGGDPYDMGLYPWSRLITVAPAREIITTLQLTMGELDKTQVAHATLARITRVLRVKDKTRADVMELVQGTYEGLVPVLSSSDALTVDDLITVGDGDTHAPSINDMQTVALARACQALGVHMDAIVKKERAIVDETAATQDLVDVIRANEIAERQKLADWAGWSLEVLI